MRSWNISIWQTLSAPLILALSFILVAESSLGQRPPGTVSDAANGHYIDRDEVNNLGWLEFNFWSKKDGKAEMPPTSLWNSHYPGDFKLPSPYRDYPIIGVSHDQVMAFCEWRSQFLTAHLKKDIAYRLPSPNEYRKLTGERSPKEKHRASQALPKNKLTHTKKVRGLLSGVYEYTMHPDTIFANGTLVHINEVPECTAIGFRCVAQYGKAAE